MSDQNPPPLVVTPAMIIGLSTALVSLQEGAKRIQTKLKELADRDPQLAAHVGPLAINLEVLIQASVSRTPSIPASRQLVARKAVAQPVSAGSPG